MPTVTNLVGPWAVNVQEQVAPNGLKLYAIIMVDQMTQNQIIVQFDRAGLEQHIRDCQQQLTGVVQPPAPKLELPR